MKRETIITIDAGTTFCKTLVWNTNGGILAQAQRMNPPIYPRPGWAEQTPKLWWDNARHTVRTALKKAIAENSDLHIAAVALTSCRDIVIPIDRHGEPLANAILWMDTRAKTEAEEIARQIGAAAVHRKTGMIPGPTFPACKILWLKKNRPEQIKNCAYFLQPRDYVFYRLTGELLTDYSMASRTMMFDQETNDWWDAMFDQLQIKTSRFPQLAGALTLRPVRSEVARQLGLLPETPVILGGGDRQCEALGAMVSEKRAMDSTGTATNISLSGPKDATTHHPKIVRSTHVVPDQLLMEVTINTSGLAMEYFRELFKGDETYFEQIEAQAAEVPAGSNGLIALPFFMGARSVRWNPRATGALFGLTFAHKDKEIIRALMESIAFEEKTALEVFREIKFVPHEIRALGGGSRSGLWNQIKADVTGIRVVTLNVSDAASFGAMALAAAATGMDPDPQTAVKRLTKVKNEYIADPGSMSKYQEIFRLYTDLYAVNEKMFDRLEKIKQY